MKKLRLAIVYLCYFAAIAAIVFLFLPSKDETKVSKPKTNPKRSQVAGNNAKVQNLPIINEKVQAVPKVYDSTQANQKYIILTFDDGWNSQYQAYQLLKPLKGTLYINSALIGKPDRLTADNLTEMYNNGWDIANHTENHVNLSKVNKEKAAKEIYECSLWIVNHGFTRNMGYKHFAYPEGGYNPDVIKILQDQNFLSARTTNPGSDTSNLLQLGRASLFGMTKANIRDLILSDKKVLILSFHRLIPDYYLNVKEIDLKESYFKEVLKAIRDSNRRVLTITEWLNLNYDTTQIPSK